MAGGQSPTSAARDDGFSLVEIIISLALLGLLFASAAPLLVGALKLSAQSAVQATATELATGQLERARASATTCADFKTFLAAPLSPATTTDARGVTYTVSQTPATSVTCPTAALINYQVSVTTSGGGHQPRVRIETQLWTVN